MFKFFKKNTTQDNWFADYRMEDGKTGRVYSTFEVDAVERVAYKKGHNAIYWSVKGGEWFNSWSY